MKKMTCGLIGTGGMAKKQIQALLKLSHAYPDSPKIELKCVTSRNEKTYQKFAKEFGFTKALSLEGFWEEEFDFLLIASPCHTHFEHLMKGLSLESAPSIYCEKPLVGSEEETHTLIRLDPRLRNKIQMGFQFLQIPAIQKARALVPTFGRLIHFEGHYLKSGYLEKTYRDQRTDRLMPAPLGGVTSDLASHVFSILISLLGNQLSIAGAIQGGSYSDVNPKSDLHVQCFLRELKSHAVGTVTASRISSGNEDEIGFSLQFENGALKFSTRELNTLWIFQKGTDWEKIQVSELEDRSEALVEAFRLFLQNQSVLRQQRQGEMGSPYIPDLSHGLQVQQLIYDTVRFL